MLQDTPMLSAHAVVRGRHAFLVGVDWVTLSTHAGKNVRGLARRHGADRVVSYRYRDASGQFRWVAGLVRRSALSLPPGTKTLTALGLLIARALSRSGYVIVPLSAGLYGFVSVLDGVLINDVAGDRETVAQAQQHFSAFNRAPEGGWLIFAPEDWGLPDSQPFDLDALLAPSPVRAARFQPVSRRKPVLMALAMVGVVLAGFYGWRTYQAHQASLRLAAVRQAVLAQQQQTDAVKPLTPPWVGLPRLMPFITACTERWQTAPLSLAGWRFKEAQCVQAGTLRLAYSKPAGATVGDFAHRVQQVYGGRHVPYFNLPGGGDVGGFSQSVSFPVSNDTRALPDADTQVQRLTTFAQRMRLPLTLTEDDNRLVTATGVETLLPWRRFSLSLETAVPPALLFDALDDVGLRLDGITLTLAGGRLTYRIEGKLYATP